MNGYKTAADGGEKETGCSFAVEKGIYYGIVGSYDGLASENVICNVRERGYGILRRLYNNLRSHIWRKK